MRIVLFIYGTLKRGMKNHSRLAGQIFLHVAQTKPLYCLLDLGPYPGLIADENQGRAVVGELWQVDESTLQKLDSFEGVPTLFQRRAVQIDSFSGEVQSYYYVGKKRGFDCGSSWPPQGDNTC